MPEFEEDQQNDSQSETYTPRTDASDKPRTRRRSGGFKNEVAPISDAKIGEVDPVQALKEEKLSGQPGADADTSDKPARRERSERKPRAEREPRQKREPREPKAPRSDANPQPSAETLAAIASVEAKIEERRAERDARRAERDKNRPAKSSGKSGSSSSRKPAAKQPAKGGLIAAVGGFFGKLFGSEPEPKKGGQRGQSRGGRPQGKGGSRSGPNRGRGGKGGGQGRGRGGKGPRRSDRRSNETVS